MKKLVGLVVMLVLLLTPVNILAQEEVENEEPGETVVQEVRSFDLFWPVVAGRVKGDTLYSLKRLKENVRGMLIFDDFERADYYGFLATKRLVEGEALVEKGDVENGKAMFGEVVRNLERARERVRAAKQKGKGPGGPGANVVKQVTNIETFSLWYRNQEKVEAKYFDEIIQRVGEVRDAI